MQRRLCCEGRTGADREQVFSLLTSYERLTDLIDQVTSSRLLVREGDIGVVELELAGAERSLVLEVVETAGRELRFAQVDSYLARGIAGSCSLQSTGQGTELSLELELPLPFYARGKARAVRACMAHFINALRRELKTPTARMSTAATRQKVLEVVQRGDRLTVWLHGKAYELNPVEPP